MFELLKSFFRALVKVLSPDPAAQQKEMLPVDLLTNCVPFDRNLLRRAALHEAGHLVWSMNFGWLPREMSLHFKDNLFCGGNVKYDQGADKVILNAILRYATQPACYMSLTTEQKKRAPQLAIKRYKVAIAGGAAEEVFFKDGEGAALRGADLYFSDALVKFLLSTKNEVDTDAWIQEVITYLCQPKTFACLNAIAESLLAAKNYVLLESELNNLLKLLD